MGSSSRVRRVVTASALAIGVGVLAACTPKPAAAPPKQAAVIQPAPTTTTLPPPSAHLTISPTSASLSTEATYDVSDTQAFTVTNDGNAASAPVGIDLDGLLNANINWRIPFDLCTGKTLDVGDSCVFLLEPHVLKYWPATTDPANFTVSAGAGVSASATVTGTLTSDLQVPASNQPLTILSPVTPGSGSKTFHVDNVSANPIGPLDFTLSFDVARAGTWQLVAAATATPCTQGMVLAAHTGCDWTLEYDNATGTGDSVVKVNIGADDGAHASGVAAGFGTP